MACDEDHATRIAWLESRVDDLSLECTLLRDELEKMKKNAQVWRDMSMQFWKAAQ